MNHIGTRRIETERLILRKFSIEDAPDVYSNWLSDPAVAMYMQWDAHADVEQTKEYVVRFYIEGYEKLDFYRWAITRKEDNGVIGSVGFHILSDFDSVADVSYALSKTFWNKGIMSEALTAVVAYAFHEVGVNRLEAFHAVSNAGSGKVLQKAGMKPEGHARQKYRDKQKGFMDCDLYAVLRDDFVLANSGHNEGNQADGDRM